MSHSAVNVYAHFVWTTKNRERVLVNNARQPIKDHLKEYAAQNDITVEAADVQPEHAHLLVSLSRSQKIEEVAKLLKGESSHWINLGDLLPGKFSWQRGYWAGSVCYQHKEAVKSYIATQDQHHKRRTFIEEFEELLRDHSYSPEEIADLLRFESR